MKLSDQVRSLHSKDGAVILDILSGEMFRSNFVGSRMLELLKQGHTAYQVVEEMSREFGQDGQTVTDDLTEFIARLESHHLLLQEQPESHPAR